MKSAENTATHFYENLGRLFYAIAAVDGRVQNKELAVLRRLVKQEWVAHDHSPDRFGSDAPFQIEYVFEWLKDEKKSAQFSLSQFADYYESHRELFSEQVKQRTWKTADAIASSFAGRNKAELVTLDKLRKILQS
jgi:hypothetical protein